MWKIIGLIFQVALHFARLFPTMIQFQCIFMPGKTVPIFQGFRSFLKLHACTAGEKETQLITCTTNYWHINRETFRTTYNVQHSHRLE